MSDIDYDALTEATKALSVIFILVICTVNAILIFIVARTIKFVYSPICLVLISLAIGDIFLALFSLVVNARQTFEPEILSFRTNLTAQYYQTFIISFVYGVGLITMAVELILRHTRLTPFLKRYQFVEAFGFSSLPWLLMLVIDLPLVLVGVDWEASLVTATIDRARAMYWVSVLVPAILAVVISLVIMFIKLEPGQNICQRSNGRVLTATYTPDFEQRHSTRNFQTTSHGTRSPHLYQPQHTQREIQNHHHTTQYITPTQHLNSHPPDATFRAPAYSPIHNTNPIKERCALLFVATIHFMCVVPQAALYVSTSQFSPRVFVILIHSFYWLSNFRSILTPAIWILYSANL